MFGCAGGGGAKVNTHVDTTPSVIVSPLLLLTVLLLQSCRDFSFCCYQLTFCFAGLCTLLGYYCLLFSQVPACCLYSSFSLHMIIMLTTSNAKMTFRESYNWGIAEWNRWSVFLLHCSLMWQNGSTVLQGSPLLSLNLCLYVLFFFW